MICVYVTRSAHQYIVSCYEATCMRSRKRQHRGVYWPVIILFLYVLVQLNDNAFRALREGGRFVVHMVL